jgi:hypothetical protein
MNPDQIEVIGKKHKHNAIQNIFYLLKFVVILGNDGLLNICNISIDSCSSGLSAENVDEDLKKSVDFYVKHNLTLTCLRDSLELQNKSRSVYQIKKVLTTYMIYNFRYFILCYSCCEYSSFENHSNTKKRQCQSCQGTLRLTDTKYFIHIPVKQQLTYIFKKYFDEIIKFKESILANSDSNIIRDVYDGTVYKNIAKKFGNDCIIMSLSLNTDGVQVFDVNKNSVWPLQLVMHFLPPHLRYRTENIIVTGLFYGRGGVDFLSYLKPVCEEFKEMENGFSVNVNNIEYNLVPTITHCVCDLPAKAKMQGFVQYNGKFGCGFCHQRGESVPNIKNKKSTIRYVIPENSPKLRTHNETAAIMIKLKKNEIKDGINKISPLLAFKNIDIVNCFGIDYMHAVLLGLMEKLFGFYLNSKYYKEELHLSSIKQSVLDKRILSMKPTIDISRKPRSILSDRHNFKANEMRSMLLYYLPTTALIGLHQKKYLDHFNLLSSSIYILSKNEISQNELQICRQNLLLFHKQYEQYFKIENVTMNLHLMHHLVDRVEKLGPLWAQSAFAYETNNGILVKSVKGTSSVLPQIAKSYILKQTKNIQENPPKYTNENLLLGLVKRIQLEPHEKIALHQHYSFQKSFPIYERAQVKKIVYTSARYKTIKSIDYFIDCHECRIAKVHFYFKSKNNLFAIIEHFEEIKKVNGHIMQIKTKKLFSVESINKIKKKWLYIEFLSSLSGLKQFVTSIPNFYEKS